MAGKSGSSGKKQSSGKKSKASGRQFTQYTSNPSSPNYTPF